MEQTWNNGIDLFDLFAAGISPRATRHAASMRAASSSSLPSYGAQ
jgi:hypothetical protein